MTDDEVFDALVHQDANAVRKVAIATVRLRPGMSETEQRDAWGVAFRAACQGTLIASDDSDATAFVNVAMRHLESVSDALDADAGTPA